MARVIRFAHLGLAVSNVAASEAFYAKVGFRRVYPYRPGLLVNNSGLELHMIESDKPAQDGKNVLMDMSDAEKFPGINHMSFGVRSVPATKTYLEGEGIRISGEREKLAIFVRDPDGTVLEFERNDGKVEEGVVVNADELSNVARGGIDHVGIRVSSPEGAVEWYARNLGFSQVTHKYELEAESIKNFRPWIIRTEQGTGAEIDINLILNCTNTSRGNALLTPDGILPGIVFAAFQVKDVDAAAAALRANGIEVVDDAGAGAFALSPEKLQTLGEGRKSIFFRDADQSVIRLVG